VPCHSHFLLLTTARSESARHDQIVYRRSRQRITVSYTRLAREFNLCCTRHTIRMKVFSSDCTFDYSWEEVSTANWRKYCPWNDKSPHVIAVDTLSRHVDPDTGIVNNPPLLPSNMVLTSSSYEQNVSLPASRVRRNG
jgi:hypothetical protein